MPRARKFRVDDRDRQILTILQQEGRLTWAELARRLDMSAPAVLARVRRLEEAEYIRGYVALLDRDKVGNGVTCYTMVELRQQGRESIDRFEEAVTTMPEVLECSHVTGDFDYLLKVIVSDREALEEFLLDKLAALSDVKSFSTNFVLREVKYETVVPVSV